HSFFPNRGLVAQQQGRPGNSRSTGRLTDLKDTSEDVARHPFFGRGYGTRVVEGPRANAALLDDEYLGRADETGIVGLVPLLLLVVVPTRRLWRRARADP